MNNICPLYNPCNCRTLLTEFHLHVWRSHIHLYMNNSLLLTYSHLNKLFLKLILYQSTLTGLRQSRKIYVTAGKD